MYLYLYLWVLVVRMSLAVSQEVHQLADCEVMNWGSKRLGLSQANCRVLGVGGEVRFVLMKEAPMLTKPWILEALVPERGCYSEANSFSE